MSENQKNSCKQGMERYFFRASAEDFRKIPGGAIAYWVSQRTLQIFSTFKPLKNFANPRQGMATTNNDKFLRQWFEVERKKTGFGLSPDEGKKAFFKWYPINKGGEFRRWYGNLFFVVNFENNGKTLCDYIDNTPGVKVKSNGRVINRDRYFHEGLTWSTISSADFSLRYTPQGSLFETKGAMIFFDDPTYTKAVLGILNTKITGHLLKATSPTLDFHEGPIGRLPILITEQTINQEARNRAEAAVVLAKTDWDSYEISWDFVSLPLLYTSHRQPTLKTSYQSLRAHWREMTLDMQRLEQENNRIFIDAYGLQDELTPEVPLNEITLTCNPRYRYGGDKSEEELEAMLLADTMRELVSYAVGCMLGRYSLDKPGLILANQGETLADYLAQVPQPSFPADDDNVIPVLDGDWFADDITLRFRQFLRVAFGEEHYEDNLAFIEQALNIKGKRNYSLRDYFLGEFYTDHVKRYKKRPIYWLFSSPKGSFNALIYMHRYRPDTVSVVLKYLRDYREKLITEKERQASVSINPATSQGDKTRALKEVDRLAKVLAELEDYERDVLYPLATEQIAIDLDDGVKVNYLKFGAALKKITGLDAKEED